MVADDDSLFTGEDILPEPPERDLIELSRRLRPGSFESLPGVGTTEPTGYESGRTDTFFVTDLIDGSVYTVQAVLEVVSEHAYWYVDDRLDLPSEAMTEAVEAFESHIYPVVTKYFGDFGSPGEGNETRLTILHTPMKGISGYYSSKDEYPRPVHPRSNHRKMIYMDGGRLRPGSPAYLGVLTHELQHAVHWRADPGEDAWVNEGMSEVAKELAGYGASFIGSFLVRPATQLNYWAGEVQLSGPHYGAATLFLSFMAQHYGGFEGLRSLVLEPSDGIGGIESYLSRHGAGFLGVFKEWVVANYLGVPEGSYSYGDSSVRVRDIELMTTHGVKTGVVPQFGAQYIDLSLQGGAALVDFRGDATVAQIPAQCHSGRYCWWSNRGDSIDSVLTREFDLTGLTEATLKFWAWFDLEDGWDYGYVEISADGGANWAILEGDHTTIEDPVGNSYGPGYTGQSKGWVQERIDLSPYAGGKVLLRFEYITDDAVYLDGLVLDDIAIPEVGFIDDAEGDVGWDAKGFVRIDNELRQRYAVQVVEQRVDGGHSVREMSVSKDGQGQILIQGFGAQLKNAVVIVSPVTPGTHQPARYTIIVSRPGGGG